MAATSNAARAAALNDAYTSPFALAEMDLSNATHTASITPLAFAANDNPADETAVASWSLGCGCGCGKRWTDFFRDYTGDGVKPTVTAPALLTIDAIPGDTSTTETLTVDGDHIISTIDTIGDEDYFSIQMVEGQTYDISMFLVVGGPSGVPLADAYIELYDSLGNLVVTADGGGPNTPSGLDAILTYTAQSTGVYYVNARAYDQDPTNGTTGDFVGDYEIFATTVDASDPTVYVPFYSPDSPLHSLDWGSQFARTSRNPDGDNGTRSDNGVANGGTPIDNNPYGIVGKNVITYYYAETGDVFVSEDPTSPGLTENIVAQGMQDWEKAAFETAFDIYENVADIQYVQVFDRNEADIKIITYEGTPGVGASLLGRMSPPGEQNAGQMEINSGDARWTEEGVSQGGFYFPTLLHELGHGHGMSHPHDNGGRSSIMRGADGGTGGIGGGFGDHGLSQQVFTIMSYNDGWEEGLGEGGAPDGHGRPRSGGLTGTEVDHFGWVGTLSALDIAVLQDKYGVNEESAMGDDVYEISDVNEAGSFYSTIWDGGGEDEIRYSGSRDATIDLRAATLRYEEGGGGRMSFALGAWTGFTIANGVTIERATGGDGDDLLIGNDADNVLTGGLGTDTLNGGGGQDTAEYSSAAASVLVKLNQGRTLDDGGGSVDTLISIENVTGSAFNDVLIGDAGANVLSGGDGSDVLIGLAGDDVLIGGGGSNTLQGGLGDDRYIVTSAGDTLTEFAGEGVDTVETTLAAYTLKDHFENLTFIGAGAFVGTGNSAANTLTGGAGDDILMGRGGDDILIGGAGIDTASYAAAASGVRAQLNTNRAVNDGDGGSDTFVGIENLTGSAFNDVLIGDAGANVLSGGAGNDILIGLAGDDVLIGGGGSNTLQGGLGDDRYIVTSAGDTLTEFAGEGVDTVETTLSSYALRDHFENLVFTGTGNFSGAGNALDNIINGGAGADVLIGGGGDDVLNGGAGDDLAVLSGVRADYTVVAGDSPDQYQITDSVGGRDGIDLLNGVERVRFSDGSTFLLSDLVEPAAAVPTSAKWANESQVLPALADDDFLIGKGDDLPWVMPDVEGDVLGLDDAAQPVFSDMDTMLTLFPDDSYLLTGASAFGRDIDDQYSWM